jgi:calcium-dependent protein kinase
MKIIDLGLGEFLNKDEYLSKLKGSIYYMAPEQIKMKYNHKVDIWACGVILYILITGTPPFNAKKYDDEGMSVVDHEGIQAKIIQGQVSYEHKTFQYIHPEAIHLIKQMLTYNPHQRPEAKQILENEWFSQTTENSYREKSKRRGSLIHQFWMKFSRDCYPSTGVLF